jgi:hypothetical protein
MVVVVGGGEDVLLKNLSATKTSVCHQILMLSLPFKSLHAIMQGNYKIWKLVVDHQ